MDRIRFVSYSGKYPNLCAGTLVLSVDEKDITFPPFCLCSGGRVWFSNGYANEHVDKGDWSVSEWPEGFPEELKGEAVDVINQNVRHGCCGGCI